GWDNVDTNLPSVFDFKLWRTSQEVFTGKKPMRALRDVLKYDGLYPNINRVTTLQNNHDTDRFMSLKDATLEGAMLHTAFILATRGIPQLYYGEEIAMTGGHDPDNRKDFPGGWREDSVSKFTKEGRKSDERKMFDWTQKWIKLRRQNRALRDGQTVDIFYDKDTYVFGRKFVGERNGETVILAFNFSDSVKEVKFSTYDNNISPRPETFSRGEGGTKMLIGDYLKNYVSNNDEHKFTIPPKSVIAVSMEMSFSK
nr:alpha-amylase family glycosyl hydrolase [Acidobacteriota bacterium]